MSNPASSSRSTLTPPLSQHQTPSSSPSRPKNRHRKSNSQMYVLSADGSRLYLLDPSTPDTHEDPPDYSSISSPHSGRLALPTSPSFADDEIGIEDRLDPSSPRSVRVHRLPSVGSSASLGSGRNRNREEDGGRERAYTTTAAGSPGGRRIYHAEGALSRALVLGGYQEGNGDPGEEMPLLGLSIDSPKGRRWAMRSIIWGEVEEDDEGKSWKDRWRRFWRPVNKNVYWRSVLHLLILNFPFALLIWPFLFAGTVAGTALLITLPIGAAVWWLTLILSRTAARVELSLQTHHHHIPNMPEVLHHPIFYRQIPLSPNTPTSEADISHIIWETGFNRCSYAMFCDYYSYSSLSYFVILKPIITLFSTIAIMALFPIALVTIFGLPIYLRAMRRWGIWQARFAITNLQ